MAGSGVDKRYPSDIFPNVRRAGRGLSPTPGLGGILNNRPQGTSVSIPLTWSGGGNPLNASPPSNQDPTQKPNHFQNIIKLLAPALGLIVGGRQGLALGTQFSTGMMDEEDQQKKEAIQQNQLNRQNKLADSLEAQRQANVLMDAMKVTETGGKEAAKGFAHQALPDLSPERSKAFDNALDSYDSSRQEMEKAKVLALAAKNTADQNEKRENANRIYMTAIQTAVLAAGADVSKLVFTKDTDGFYNGFTGVSISPKALADIKKKEQEPGMSGTLARFEVRDTNPDGTPTKDGLPHRWGKDRKGNFTVDMGLPPGGKVKATPGTTWIEPGLDPNAKKNPLNDSTHAASDSTAAPGVKPAAPKKPVQPFPAQPDTTGIYAQAYDLVTKKTLNPKTGQLELTNNPDTGQPFASISEARAWLLKNAQ